MCAAAAKYTLGARKPAALNFANQGHAGGGYLRGCFLNVQMGVVFYNAAAASDKGCSRERKQAMKQILTLSRRSTPRIQYQSHEALSRLSENLFFGGCRA